MTTYTLPDCPICMDTTLLTSTTCTPCGHLYHTTCLFTWASKDKTSYKCPQCGTSHACKLRDNKFVSGATLIYPTVEPANPSEGAQDDDRPPSCACSTLGRCCHLPSSLTAQADKSSSLTSLYSIIAARVAATFPSLPLGTITLVIHLVNTATAGACNAANPAVVPTQYTAWLASTTTPRPNEDYLSYDLPEAYATIIRAIKTHLYPDSDESSIFPTLNLFDPEVELLWTCDLDKVPYAPTTSARCKEFFDLFWERSKARTDRRMFLHALFCYCDVYHNVAEAAEYYRVGTDVFEDWIFTKEVEEEVDDFVEGAGVVVKEEDFEGLEEREAWWSDMLEGVMRR